MKPKRQYGGECSTKYLYICGSLLATFLLTSDIMAVKFFEIAGIKMGGAYLTIPFVLVTGDVVTEVYGFRNARRIIVLALCCFLFYTVISQIILHMPPAESWEKQDAFEAIFSHSPRILIAGSLAYLAGELSNSWVLSRLKITNDGRHFWWRAMASTIVGQTANTFTFMFSAFGGIMSTEFLLEVIWNGIIIKTLIEAALLPVTYFCVRKLKEAEGMDYFDLTEDFKKQPT